MQTHPDPFADLDDCCPLCDMLRADMEADAVAPLRRAELLLPDRRELAVDVLLAAIGDLDGPVVDYGVNEEARVLEADLADGGMVRVDVWAGMLNPHDLGPALESHPLWRAGRRWRRRVRGSWHVTVNTPPGPPVPTQLRVTRLLAGLAAWTGALGVAWDEPMHAIPAERFVALGVDASAAAPPVALWVRPTVAWDAAEREVSVLSWGLRRFDAPELLITAPPERRREALGLLYERAAAIVRGERLERALLQPSPVRAGRQVLWEPLEAR